MSNKMIITAAVANAIAGIDVNMNEDNLAKLIQGAIIDSAFMATRHPKMGKSESVIMSAETPAWMGGDGIAVRHPRIGAPQIIE